MSGWTVPLLDPSQVVLVQTGIFIYVKYSTVSVFDRPSSVKLHLLSLRGPPWSHLQVSRGGDRVGGPGARWFQLRAHFEVTEGRRGVIANVVEQYGSGQKCAILGFAIP